MQHTSEMCRPPSPLTYQASYIPVAVQTVNVKYLLISVYKGSLSQRTFFSTHPPSPRTYSHKSPPTSYSHSESFPRFQDSRGSNTQAAPPEINRTIVFKQHLRVLKVNHAVKCYLESESEKSHIVI